MAIKSNLNVCVGKTEKPIGPGTAKASAGGQQSEAAELHGDVS